jgi:hypothetical protein
VDNKTNQLQMIDQALQARRPTRGDNFAMTLQGHRYTERTKAKQSLIHHLAQFRDYNKYLDLGWSRSDDRIARLGGLDLSARARGGLTGTEISVHVHGIPDSEVKLSTDDWRRPTPGLITRLQNKIGELDKLRLDTEAAISRTRTEIERGTAQLGAPFSHTDELAAARAQLAAIEAEMQAQAAPPPDEQTTPDGNAAPAEHGQLFLLSEGQSIPGGSARHRGRRRA